MKCFVRYFYKICIRTQCISFFSLPKEIFWQITVKLRMAGDCSAIEIMKVHTEKWKSVHSLIWIRFQSPIFFLIFLSYYTFRTECWVDKSYQRVCLTVLTHWHLQICRKGRCSSSLLKNTMLSEHFWLFFSEEHYSHLSSVTEVFLLEPELPRQSPCFAFVKINLVFLSMLNSETSQPIYENCCHWDHIQLRPQFDIFSPMKPLFLKTVIGKRGRHNCQSQRGVCS